MRQLKIAADRLTSRTENISRYLNEVSTRSVLSPDEEFKIGMRAQQGDEEAIEILISSNLRFVISVAKQYASTGALLEDLICQGNIGLCDAARLYDPTRGFKFISFAVWHIRKEILAYLNASHRTVKLPQNILNDLAKIRRLDEAILQEHGRYGTAEELQEAALKIGKDLTLDYIKIAMRSDSKPIPLESDEPDEHGSPINWLSSGSNPTHITDEEDLKKTAAIALSKLSEIQRDIVTRRLGIGYSEAETFSTIAARYSKTPEWARSLYSKSMRLMYSRLRRSSLTYDRVLNHEV